MMEDDDWVKFGLVIWAGRTEGRQQFALKRYQQAWKNLHKTEPPLDRKGRPKNFLHNEQYTCRKAVPWLATALEDGPLEDSPDDSPDDSPSEDGPALQPRTSTSIHHPPSNAEPGPSTYRTASQEAGPSYSDVPEPGPFPASPGNSMPSPRGPSTPEVPPTKEEPVEASLDRLFKNSTYEVESIPPFSKIKGGFFAGFRDYLARPFKNCLRVIFPIIPQYQITNQNNKSTAYVNPMEISPADADAISQVDSKCLYRAENQAGCPKGQVRYFCSSWVSVISFYFIW